MAGEKPDGARASEDRAWMPPSQSAAAAAAGSDSLAGYSELVEIGRGGDSIVYRARQDSLNRGVAIKVLLLDDEETVARFAREIEITVELGRQHPNIMTVLATGTTASGRPAIVMDHYERGSLDQRLRESGPLPAAEVVTVGCVLADALQFAHEHGVLHRDVKPQNVMILPTSYVLGDFGIARLADSEHTASAERFTVRHASPQILDGRAPTAQDDVWSLGSTLFTLLDGRTPFASSEPGDDTALAYLRRARTEPHRQLPLDSANRGLVEVIDRALAKDPAQRWPDIASMRAALEELRGSFLQAWSPEATGSIGQPHSRKAVDRQSSVADSVAPPAEGISGGQDSTAERDVAHSAAPGPGTVAGAVATSAATSAAATAAANSAARGRDGDQAASVAPSSPHPVALSVLAHGSGVAATDAEPTGLVPGAKPGPMAAELDSGSGGGFAGEVADEAQNARSAGRVVLALAAVALAVGVTLGALGGILRQDGDDAQPDSAPTTPGNSIPTLDRMPVETGDDQPLQIDDSMKPIITKIDVRGTSAVIEWRDRSDGKVAHFVIAQIVPAYSFLAQVESGGSEFTIEGIDPDWKRLCFIVTAVGVDGSVARSQPTCPKKPD